MALTSRLSKLKEAADKRKKSGAGKAEATKSAPQKEAVKPATPPAKQPPKEVPRAEEQKPRPARSAAAEQPPQAVAPPPVQASAPPASLNVLIMSDERIPQLPDKLEVFRNVLKRYDEIEKGKDAKEVVEEEIEAFLAKKK